ncbi:MAG: Fic family protein [Sulfuritalea sp.]|nr:Fic family protein [Sulfuritalea sp.]
MAASAAKRQAAALPASILEVLIPGDATAQRRVQRLAKNGTVARIAKGIYVPATDPEGQAAIVRRHWQTILGHLFPGAVVSHLSALVGGITPSDEITLTHPTRFNTSLQLPGLTAVLMKGPGSLPGDLPLGDSGLYWCSRPRWLLENLGRSRTDHPRTAGKNRVEERLVSILHAGGEGVLNRVRDDARNLAPELGAEKAFDALSAMVGALLGSYAKGALISKAGKLVANGTPADAERLTRFQILADHLRTVAVSDIGELAGTEPAKTHFAFLESYFSNYVEGTRFSIEEAEGIALHNQIVADRPADSHDILGVFHLILHAHYRSNLPTAMEILDGLKERHRLMLERRPEASPGEFKEQENFAGSTRFVDPGFVRGTLLEGIKLAASVPEGLARAIFYAFLVSEVHPFSDGNGRLSRLLMNAELSRCSRSRIIIPTLFHEQYVDAQRALSRRNDPQPLVRALSHIAKWAPLFDFADLKDVVTAMKAANAFEEEPRQFQLLAPDGAIFA